MTSRRLGATIALALLLLAPLASGSAASATTERRYDAGVLGVDGAGCRRTASGDYEGTGAACFTLDGAPATATVTLVDDALGRIPAEWVVRTTGGAYLTGAFCGAATLDVPVDAYFLYVGVSPYAASGPSCDASAGGTFTTGNVTLTLAHP